MLELLLMLFYTKKVQLKKTLTKKNLKYNLRFFRIWWRDPGSNWGHTDFQSVALPTELSRRCGVLSRIWHQ